ncbi:TspO/MBR family protein [Nonomuraea muscovyensis]|uniref:TspO/MBR family protein n=1 Tax=Nonomuraea muscovyensis TaxID=1124761 RepID=UPI0033C29A21
MTRNAGRFARTLLATGTAVAAGAAIGARSTDSRSPWYRKLRKPPWQPPPQAFGLVWTPLYALLAYAGARALTTASTPTRPAPAGAGTGTPRTETSGTETSGTETSGTEAPQTEASGAEVSGAGADVGVGRAGLAWAFAVNLALNTAWTPLFFAARSPRLAMLDILALNASNLVLLRRFLRADRRAGLALVPYVAWTAFATALNGAIVARNPDA